MYPSSFVWSLWKLSECPEEMLISMHKTHWHESIQDHPIMLMSIWEWIFYLCTGLDCTNVAMDIVDCNTCNLLLSNFTSFQLNKILCNFIDRCIILQFPKKSKSNPLFYLATLWSCRTIFVIYLGDTMALCEGVMQVPEELQKHFVIFRVSCQARSVLTAIALLFCSDPGNECSWLIKTCES